MRGLWSLAALGSTLNDTVSKSTVGRALKCERRGVDTVF